MTCSEVMRNTQIFKISKIYNQRCLDMYNDILVQSFVKLDILEGSLALYVKHTNFQSSRSICIIYIPLKKL